jgi:hypothetical protein
MRTAVEILVEARRLIRTPKKWTQGAYCRGRDGRSVSTNADGIARYCAVGAIYVARGKLKASNKSHGKAEGALRHVTQEVSIITFNDQAGRTHKEVMKAFDKAIAFLKTRRKS